MSVSYDNFTDAFLSKVSEYDFLEIPVEEREDIIDGFMKKAIVKFKKNCLYDLTSTANDFTREFDIEIEDEDIDEIVDIISDGMVVQWLKPYLNKQDLLQNVLNTRDFTLYSPSELLKRVGETYKDARKEFVQAIREYSYNHGDIGRYHI